MTGDELSAIALGIVGMIYMVILFTAMHIECKNLNKGNKNE